MRFCTRGLGTEQGVRAIGAGMILPFGTRQPQVDPSAFVVASAVVLGDVALGAEASIWFHAVVRADMEPIRIGAQSNVQDNATLHVVGGKLANSLSVKPLICCASDRPASRIAP